MWDLEPIDGFFSQEPVDSKGMEPSWVWGVGWVMWFSLSFAFALTPSQLKSSVDPLLKEAAAVLIVRADFERLAKEHGFRPTDVVYEEYLRVVLAFEATRDGGWIGNRWTITNQEPNSTQVFAQYTNGPHAKAECDELSAQFSWTARQLGVANTGLFWPTWNHTVSVWWFDQDAKRFRIVVPTSQIFLDENATLGTTGFDAWTQKTIYRYTAKDATGELPAAFVDGLLHGARCGLSRGLSANQARRNTEPEPLRCLGSEG